MKNKVLCIVGVGGFGREVLCCHLDMVKLAKSQHGNVVFLVDDEYYNDDSVMNTKVIKFSEFDPDIYSVVIAIGEPDLRELMVKKLPSSTEYATLVHPTAVVSEWVELGEGTIITAGCVVTCNIKLGKHSHLNLNTTVGHDCVIGNYFTTAPGCHISGNCTFGENVYLGTGVSIREKIEITDKVVIGMGGVVVKSIKESGLYVGSPARIFKK